MEVEDGGFLGSIYPHCSQSRGQWPAASYLVHDDSTGRVESSYQYVGREESCTRFVAKTNPLPRPLAPPPSTLAPPPPPPPKHPLSHPISLPFSATNVKTPSPKPTLLLRVSLSSKTPRQDDLHYGYYYQGKSRHLGTVF